MASIKNNKVTFRHPLIMDGKYGKVFAPSVQTYTELEQTQIKMDVETLVEAKPYSRADVPKRADGNPLHERALKAYFDPMEKAGVKGGKGGFRESRDNYKLSQTPRPNDPHGQISQYRLEQWQKALARNVQLERRVAELEDFIKDMQVVSGARSEAERQTTLAECVAHFETKFRVKGSPEQRDDIIRRVKTIAGALGLATKYAEITLHSIEDAVTTSKPATEGEEFKRKQAIKRFFRFLAFRQNEGGLGFATNPAQNMYVGSVGAIQKRNVQKHGILLADPAVLLKIDGLPAFHRVAFAMLGYAGLRLSEFAGLLWEDIDEKKKIIRIKPNDIKTGIKTGDSYRLVKPFENVWEYIKDWKEQTSGSRFAFPRPSNGKTWFTVYKERARCVALSHFLQDELKRKNFEPNDKIALRLRHYWSTTMDEKGYGQYEAVMGGHSKATAQSHYQERERLVMSARIGRI